MKSTPEILLAEDERAVRKSLAAMLSDAGYAVREARDGAAALKLFAESRPDLVLLDVMMPRLDGFETCRRLREIAPDAPVLFLTALGDEESQLRGFGCGADDYIAKTLPASLLLARVAAALRRARREDPSGDFDVGAWRVCAAKLEMRRGASARAALSEREVALLRLFAARPGEVFSRDFLLTRFWGTGSDVSDNALSAAMHALREKLAEDGARLRPVRGVGYVFGAGRRA